MNVDVWIADAPPCTAQDLEGAMFAANGEARAPAGARCPAWAVAGPGERRGTLRAALCELAACQPASTWAYEVFTPAANAETKKGFPAWATWTIAGVGVATAASLILWRTGAFDRSEPSKRVIYDGSGL
jgi:hypothetical protein